MRLEETRNLQARPWRFLNDQVRERASLLWTWGNQSDLSVPVLAFPRPGFARLLQCVCPSAMTIGLHVILSLLCILTCLLFINVTTVINSNFQQLDQCSNTHWNASLWSNHFDEMY